MTAMKFVLALAASLSLLASAPAQSATSASADDTAKFLAGIAPAADSPLTQQTKTPYWQQHKAYFDSAFGSFEQRQSSKIRAFAEANLTSPKPVLFYMFSGPDFLYADAFFPKATTYVLSGLEPTGPIPDLVSLPPGSVVQALSGLQHSLRTVLSATFFITNNMSSDLRAGRVYGTIPVLYVFLARTGHTIKDASLILLDEKGEMHPDDGKTKSGAHGVKIVFSKDNGPEQTLYYFSTNLDNSGVKTSGFLEFCGKLSDNGDAFVKSASYLLHGGGFSTVRDFLLSHATTITQDDTGVPLAYFDPKKWDLHPYGNYVVPIPIFAGQYQPKLKELFIKEHAKPIDFGLGYHSQPAISSVLIATRKDRTANP